MDLLIIFGIIIGHWVSDFILQDEEWANNKSKNNLALIKHTSVYSSVMSIFVFTILIIQSGGGPSDTYWKCFLIFLPVTFILHTVTDYITSREVSYKFQKKHYGSAIPNFGGFTIIGLDQVLHYVQLFLTYKILFI